MACKIKRVDVSRVITEDEFIAQKEAGIYKEYRQLGKTINFLTLFGGSPKMFASEALDIRWTEEQADDYIRENKLENAREKTAEKYKRESEKMISFITVAAHMQNTFFTSYPGLYRRIQNNKKFAQDHGYIRTMFGATRNLIQQFFRGEYDNKENGALMRNLDNICANTDIQGFEAGVIHPAMADTEDWLLETHKRSFGWNCVHDSYDLCVYKPELAEVSSKIEEIFTRAIPELKGLPLAVDFTVSDLTKGEFYKGGSSLHAYL